MLKPLFSLELQHSCLQTIGASLEAATQPSLDECCALCDVPRLPLHCTQYPGQLLRACVELAKAWRSDKYLRRLEATIVACDPSGIFTVDGMGNVLEGDEGVLAAGTHSVFCPLPAVMFPAPFQRKLSGNRRHPDCTTLIQGANRLPLALVREWRLFCGGGGQGAL